VSDDQQEFGPFLRRLILGKELRKLRGDRKLKEVAHYAGISEASISRIESGKQVILPRTVRALCQVYEVGAPQVDMLVRQAEQSNERGVITLDADFAPDWSAPFFEMEADASEVWTFEAQAVPGLLQVPGYIAALVHAAESRGADPNQIISVRATRQRRLAGNRPLRLRVVLDEAVVTRPVGGPLVMAEQVSHLAEMAGLDHVDLRLLPFSAGAHIAMTGSFTMLRFPDELDIGAVYLEHDHAGTMAERPSDLARYSYMFERLGTAALNREETRSRLVSLAEHYRASGRGSGG
jgi:transcriptional regulator with XRE-family HTH domain